jgi:hypothetical protein
MRRGDGECAACGCVPEQLYSWATLPHLLLLLLLPALMLLAGPAGATGRLAIPALLCVP